MTVNAPLLDCFFGRLWAEGRYVNGIGIGTFAGLRLTRPITADFAAVEKKALQVLIAIQNASRFLKQKKTNCFQLGAKAFVCENLQRELVDEVVKRAIQVFISVTIEYWTTLTYSSLLVQCRL